MYDRRYPTMHPIDRPLPLEHAAEVCLRRVGTAIASRSGTRCFYNSATRTLLFCCGDEPHGGPLRLPAFQPDGVTPRRYEAHEIDEAVRCIGLGRVDRRDKDRWGDRARREEEYTNQQARQKKSDAIRPDALDYAAFRDRARRGVSKVTVA